MLLLNVCWKVKWFCGGNHVYYILEYSLIVLRSLLLGLGKLHCKVLNIYHVSMKSQVLSQVSTYTNPAEPAEWAFNPSIGDAETGR